MARRRGGLVGGLAGLLAGLLIAGAIPAMAGNGDNMVIGEKNTAIKLTRLNSRGGLRIDNFKEGNPALYLNVADPADAPMEVNATGLVDNLNADTVDGYEANELVRAAYDYSEDVADANGTALTATITAPTPGLLLINAGLEVYDVLFDYLRCEIYLNGSDVAGGGRDIIVADAQGEHTDNSAGDCSTSATAPVAAGVHTVTLEIGSRDSALLTEGSLSVLFVPFGGTGQEPAPEDR